MSDSKMMPMRLLAKRGYVVTRVYAAAPGISEPWQVNDANRSDIDGEWFESREEAMEAASRHCRENYVPPRPKGVPPDAEFRLPRKGEFVYAEDNRSTSVCEYNWSLDKDKYKDELDYNWRRWCWPKPKQDSQDQWTPKTFPRGTIWIRKKSWVTGCRSTVVGITMGGIEVINNTECEFIDYADLAEKYEISCDGGSTWEPAKPRKPVVKPPKKPRPFLCIYKKQ